ncbi:MAG: thiamine pyrophosphate-dependent dehydrogenase E1 component subunit alpha [Chloroflexota bacterium]|nr:thiamine pyrophosphate-dependent dehydrogenase E1 component subunit alpha [Chloroflexota bacterium]
MQTLSIRLPDIPDVAPLGAYDEDLLAEIYRRMVLIRQFELKVNELFLGGIMPGTIHLSLGQEASVVGACLALEADDVITLTHRGHGQALAKGVRADALMAELFGKETGCCRGKGGSLHVGDMSVGALPAIAIVGASSPIAAGMAFAFKRGKTGQVALNFFGEGTVNKGDWHEALNLAAIWKLPVVFLCENNLYGVSTHITEVMAIDYVAERASAYGMPGGTIYGNDPIVVYEAVRTAAERARAGEGPALIECLTYRRGGHKRDDPGTYRPQEEVEAWFKTDPLPAFRERLLQDARFSVSEVEALDTAVATTIDAAVRFALASESPAVASALEHVYAD